MKLTAIAVKQAKPKEKSYKLSDGKGLFLLVKASGGKYWRQAYRHLQKQKTLSLGVYPGVSLSEARELCNEAHKKIRAGIDPNEEKRTKKLEQIESALSTFSGVAEVWYSNELPHWAKATAKKRRALLDNDLIPVLGDRPIKGLVTKDLLACLKKIEERGAIDTAHNGRQVLTQIFTHAKQCGLIKNNEANDLKGGLSKKDTTHRAAITNPPEFGMLMSKIEQYPGTPIIKAMLSLAPLVFQRPGELASMEWQEIDFETKLWVIPKEKKKERNKRDDNHIVPLSKQAIVILKDIQRLTGNEKYVFPGQRRDGSHANPASINKVLRNIGYCTKTEHSFHGFRASATTMLNERLEYRIDWIEQQMGHNVKDALGRAYNRTQHLDKRTEMMQGWADYLDKLKQQIKSGKIIPATFGVSDEAKKVGSK